MAGPNQPLGHGLFAVEEGPGDFLCGQAAQRAQGERHAGFLFQRRVAARKDHAQAIIFDILQFLWRVLVKRQKRAILRHLAVKVAGAPQPVDGLAPRNLQKPSRGRLRQATLPPMHDGGLESILQAVFGQLQIADIPHQCRKKLGRVLARDGGDGRPRLLVVVDDRNGTQ